MRNCLFRQKKMLLPYEFCSACNEAKPLFVPNMKNKIK
jgi:hypothetical protein